MKNTHGVWNKYAFAFFRQVKFCIPALNCLGLPDSDRGPFIPHQVTHLKTDFFVNAALFVLTFALPPWVKCWIWTLQKPTPAGDVKVTQVLFCVIASFGLCDTSNRELVLSVSLAFSPAIVTLDIHSVFFSFLLICEQSQELSHSDTDAFNVLPLAGVCVWLVGC